MGEKEELKHFFTCNGKVIETIPEILISDGTVIEGGILHRNEDGTLCSITPQNVVKVVSDTIGIHNRNRTLIDYLYRYMKGNQPILYRNKIVRPEVNNRVVENHAFETVKFKAGQICGEPIQYVCKKKKADKKINEQVDLLNDYLDEANADARNIQRAIYQSATGTSYKAILKEEDWTENGDLPPFRIFIPYPGDCYIVYSQRNGKPMLSVQILKDEDEQQYYLCYSKKQFFKITNGKVTEYGINGFGGIPIVECPNNHDRLSDVEIAITLFDAINKYQSDRLNGVEQFVQAFMKFKNCEVDENEFLKMVREKFLLVEIHSLRKRDKSGDCFASNRHFADFIGVSERTIQSMLNGLKQNGYITSWYEYEKDNPKVIKHRHLILTEKFYEEFINEHEQKDQPERGEKKRMGDGEKNCTFRGEENCVDKYNSEISITDIDKKTEPDFIDNKEKKTLSYTDKDNQTSAPNNYNKLNIYNIPPRTKEQKANRYNSRNQSSILDYKDEDVEKLVTEIYESIYGTKENIFEDHDICLSIFLITEFFKKYQKYREKKHPMVTPNQAENILKMVRNPDTDMAKDDLVDDKEEPLFYLDMMEEHFKTKWGKRNGGDFDYRIMLFFKDTTQNMLYQRVKQKREDTL